MKHISDKYGQLFVSIVIVSILGAQSLAVAFRSDGWFWPFLDYPMYSRLNKEGDRLDVFHPLFAVLADGSEKQVLPEDLGLQVFMFELQLVPTIKCAAHASDDPLPVNRCRPDKAKDWLRKLLDPYEQRQHTKIIGLRLEEYGYVLKRSGVEKAPGKVLQVLELKEQYMVQQ